MDVELQNGNAGAVRDGELRADVGAVVGQHSGLQRDVGEDVRVGVVTALVQERPAVEAAEGHASTPAWR